MYSLVLSQEEMHIQESTRGNEKVWIGKYQHSKLIRPASHKSRLWRVLRSGLYPLTALKKKKKAEEFLVEPLAVIPLSVTRLIRMWEDCLHCPVFSDANLAGHEIFSPVETVVYEAVLASYFDLSISLDGSVSEQRK
jgi:hypothetical protein